MKECLRVIVSFLVYSLIKTQIQYYYLKAKIQILYHKKKKNIKEVQKEVNLQKSKGERIKIFVLISMILVALSSCVPNQNIKPHLNLSQPQNPVLIDFEFVVLETDQGSYVCLSQNSYKTLTLNMKQILNYSKTQNSIIKRYKEYYEK